MLFLHQMSFLGVDAFVTYYFILFYLVQPPAVPLAELQPTSIHWLPDKHY